jgi:uncharacterized protein with von Willebrand factor type A (vWA) domain
VIVLIDQSGSMGAKDAPGGLTRFDAADEELMRLQKAHPGQVAVISFSTNVQFNPGGLPNREGAMTNMAKALDFARIADGASRIVLISDGEPDSESATLEAAGKYRHPIHTIYIGPEDGRGRDFLTRLARTTGGQMYASEAPGLLAESVTDLLLLAA